MLYPVAPSRAIALREAALAGSFLSLVGSGVIRTRRPQVCSEANFRDFLRSMVPPPWETMDFDDSALVT